MYDDLVLTNVYHVRMFELNCIVLCCDCSYLGYMKDDINDGTSSVQESFMALLAFGQFVLLGTFAAILAAHRSEIIEKEDEPVEGAPTPGSYEAPYQAS